MLASLSTASGNIEMLLFKDSTQTESPDWGSSGILFIGGTNRQKRFHLEAAHIPLAGFWVWGT